MASWVAGAGLQQLHLSSSLRARSPNGACPPVRCRWFVTKEDLYPLASNGTGLAGACNKARTASIGPEDKVQLTGGGFKQLRPWSAAALREVRAGPCHVWAGQRLDPGQQRPASPVHCCNRPCPLPAIQAVRVAPVMVGIYASEDSMFEFYSGGIWAASSCALPPGAPDPAKALVNHAVLVVGWNMLYQPYYWIVKNSWGRG